MSTTTCPVCHSPLGPQEAYCRHCGTRVAVPVAGDGRPLAAAAPPAPAPSAGPRDLGVLSPALAGAVPAPVGRRIGAGLIDGLLGPVGLALFYLASGVQRALAWRAPLSPAVVWRLSQYSMGGGGVVVLYLGAAVVWVVFWRWNARTGLTVGRLATGLRLVAADAGTAPGWGRALGRNVILGAFGAVTCGVLGWLPVASILWDGEGRNRGWHDKWSRCVVIDARFGRDPLAGTGQASVTAGRAEAVARTVPAVPLAPATAPAGPPRAATESAPPSTVAAAPMPAAIPAFPPPPPPPVPTAVEPAVAPAAPAPAPTAGPVPPVPAAGVITAVPGVLSPPPPPPAPVAMPEAEPASPVPAFRTGHTGAPPAAAAVAEEAERTVMRAPRRLGAVTLAFDTGERVGVSRGVGLVGREPEPRPGESVDHLVPIDDPDRSVSKTHLSFGVDGRGFWVLDRASTNGTRVLRGDVELAEVGEDAPTYVAVGDVVEFGDRRFVVQRD